MPPDEFVLPCFRCGVCCTKYRARPDFIEARRIADELGLTWETWLERYADPSCPRTDSFLLRRDNGACVFLKHEKGNKVSSCLIYSCRPSACADWSPSLYRPACQHGLTKYWELAVSTSGRIEGSEQQLRDFTTFLKSLVEQVGLDKSVA